METTINKRISVLMESLRMNPNVFSKSVGKSYTALDSVIKGKSKPSFEFLEAILEVYPTVSPAWLLAGEGEIFRLANKPEDGGAFGGQVAERLFEEFTKLREQLSVKDRQLEAAGRTVEGLQRTVDALLSRPAATAGNFNEPATHEAGIILPLHKETALLVA